MPLKTNPGSGAGRIVLGIPGRQESTMFIKWLSTCVLGGALFMATASQRPADSHSETITKSPTEYIVTTPAGTAVGNLTLTLENVGDVPVVNPRLTVNGRLDWFDKKSVVAEAVGDAKTDEEKVLAIWRFAMANHQRMTPPGDLFISDPVAMFNVYGYGNCGCISPVIMVMAQTAGYRARVWELVGHTVSEVYFNDAWHMIDGDTGRMLRDPNDNHILSVAEIQNRELWRLFKKDNRGYDEHAYDKYALSNHAMAVTLRRGEQLVRSWTPSGKFYNYLARDHYKPDQTHWLPPTRYASGKLIFRPQFTVKALDSDAFQHEFLVPKAKGADGPVLRVEAPAAGVERPPRVGQVTYHVKSPYVIVGAKLEAEFFRAQHTRSGQDYIAVDARNAWTASRKDQSEGWVRLYGAAWSSDIGALPTVVDFGDLFNTSDRNREGIYEYDIRFRFSASDPVQYPVGMSDLVLTTELQVAPLSIPGLTTGENRLRYRDESPDGRKVRITHEWSNSPETPNRDASDSRLRPPAQSAKPR